MGWAAAPARRWRAGRWTTAPPPLATTRSSPGPARWTPAPGPASPAATTALLSGTNLSAYGRVELPLNVTLPWDAILQLGDLAVLDMTSAGVHGAGLPGAVLRLRKLSYISLADNDLGGTVPSRLGDLSELSYLVHPALQLRPLPVSLTGSAAELPSPSVHCPDLSSNSLNGTLPLSLGRLASLQYLILQSNQLTGDIPRLAAMPVLQIVDLSSNAFSGMYPTKLAAFPQLQQLHLQNNFLTGPLPNKLFTNNLTLVDVSFNYLNGKLLFAVPSFASFSFAGNCIEGQQSQRSSSACASFYEGVSTNETVLGEGYSYLQYDAAASMETCHHASHHADDAKLCLEWQGVSICLPQLKASLRPSSVPHSTFAGSSSNATNTLGHMHSSSNTGLIVGIAVSVAVLVLLVILLIIIVKSVRRTRRKKMVIVPHFAREEYAKRPPSQQVMILNPAELEDFTKSYSMVVHTTAGAELHYAEPMTGRLAGMKLVVKRCTSVPPAEFLREVRLLLRLHHRNLLNLVGYCTTGNDSSSGGTNQALVYEYMPNESLCHRLHEGTEGLEQLSWEKRVQIAHDVACGLEYLHHGFCPAIVHGGIKSAAVLLSAEDVAKVAVPAPWEGRKIWLTMPLPHALPAGGAHGFDIGPLHTGDVRDFGVLLLELLSGSKVVQEDPNLHDWAQSYMEDALMLPFLVDPKLGNSFRLQELIVLVEIACQCVAPNPVHRPSMQTIVTWMEEKLNAARFLVVGDADSVPPDAPANAAAALTAASGSSTANTSHRDGGESQSDSFLTIPIKDSSSEGGSYKPLRGALS
eukprot:SM000002S05642  [mRNA]  locus=s2:1333164:1337387:- [translate_table: standard]